VYSLGPAPFIEPWNPWGGLFAFFFFIALCWGVICGRHRWLPIAAFAGYFAVQCHAGYALLVGAGLAGTTGFVIWTWWRARRVAADPEIVVAAAPSESMEDESPAPATAAPATDTPPATGEPVTMPPTRQALLRSFLYAVVVTVLMWLPPVIDQIRHNPGNLSILWHHFTASTEADGSPRVFVGLGAAFKEFAGELSVAGPWIRGPFRQPVDAPNIVTFLLALALIGIALVVLVRRRDLPRRAMLIRLFTTLGVLVVVGIVSTSRIFGEFYDYVVRWWWIIVAWLIAGCVLVLSRLVDSRRTIAGLVAATVLMSGLATANAVGDQNPGPRNSRLVGGIVPAITGSLNHHDHYLIRWYDPATLGGVPFGVLLELEKRGFHVGVDAQSSAGALPYRVLPETSANSVLWVVLGDSNIDRMKARTDVVELGYFDQRSPAEIAQSNALRQHLIDRLNELGKACLVPSIDVQYGLAAFVIGNAPVPPDVAKTAGDYDLLGLPAAVFQLPPGAPAYVAPGNGC